MNELAIKILNINKAIRITGNPQYLCSPTPENWAALVERAKEILKEELGD